MAFDFEQSLEVGELEVDIDKLEELLAERKAAPQSAPQRQVKGCGCAKQECGCSPGLQKQHCRRCRHHKCPEPDCGGPLALQQAQMSPQRQPLRPTEIPMKLPVKLTFGVQQPQVEQTRIRRQPLQPQLQQQKGGCACQKGYCHLHHRNGPAHGNVPAYPLPRPPVPRDRRSALVDSAHGSHGNGHPSRGDLATGKLTPSAAYADA